MYAWSEIRNGGDVEEISLLNGGVRTVVSRRNAVAPGEKVTKKELDCSDDEWDDLVERGVIRPYPFPEGVNEYTSPTSAILAQLAVGGDVPADRLLELALAHPPAANLPASEAAELEAPEGV